MPLLNFTLRATASKKKKGKKKKHIHTPPQKSSLWQLRGQRQLLADDLQSRNLSVNEVWTGRVLAPCSQVANTWLWKAAFVKLKCNMSISPIWKPLFVKLTQTSQCAERWWKRHLPHKPKVRRAGRTKRQDRVDATKLTGINTVLKVLLGCKMKTVFLLFSLGILLFQCSGTQKQDKYQNPVIHLRKYIYALFYGLNPQRSKLPFCFLEPLFFRPEPRTWY